MIFSTSCSEVGTTPRSSGLRGGCHDENVRRITQDIRDATTWTNQRQIAPAAMRSPKASDPSLWALAQSTAPVATAQRPADVDADCHTQQLTQHPHADAVRVVYFGQLRLE